MIKKVMIQIDTKRWKWLTKTSSKDLMKGSLPAKQSFRWTHLKTKPKNTIWIQLRSPRPKKDVALVNWDDDSTVKEKQWVNAVWPFDRYSLSLCEYENVYILMTGASSLKVSNPLMVFSWFFSLLLFTSTMYNWPYFIWSIWQKKLFDREILRDQRKALLPCWNLIE